MSDYPFAEEARALAAQCWTDDETSGIDMDIRLAEAFARRLASWMQDAALYAKNTEFWRGLLEQCAQKLGPAAYTADDGTVMEDPVYLKVPELVAGLVASPD